MTWSEVAELADSGVVTIGSHARSHVPLPTLETSALQHELVESRREIEARTGKPVESIAFPDGAHDQHTVEAARDAGYGLAFTTVNGRVQRGDDVLRLRRVNLHEGATRTEAGFLCRIAGIF